MINRLHHLYLNDTCFLFNGKNEICLVGGRQID